MILLESVDILPIQITIYVTIYVTSMTEKYKDRTKIYHGKRKRDNLKTGENFRQILINIFSDI